MDKPSLFEYSELQRIQTRCMRQGVGHFGLTENSKCRLPIASSEIRRGTKRALAQSMVHATKFTAPGSSPKSSTPTRELEKSETTMLSSTKQHCTSMSDLLGDL